MSNLSDLSTAISTNDTYAVRTFCEQNRCPNIGNRIQSNFNIDPFSLSVMALENNNLDIFKILFIWSRKNGSVWLFYRAISLNQLPFVQYLYPFVQDDLCKRDRIFLLEDMKEPEFGALYVWLDQAFYPQMSFDRWQDDWGFNLELLFNEPSIYEMETELNAKRAAGLIDEDGYSITACPGASGDESDSWY